MGVLTGAAFTPAPLNISLDQPISGFGFREAFPGIRFEQPVTIVSAPGETNRVFVVERRGVIWAITNLAQPVKSIFLDLSSRTIWDLPFNESGCLGLAFHPGFATNGYFFVYRVTYPGGDYGRNTLSRFSASADRSSGDPASELVLFAQRDASIVHNAGCLRFGLDGYLYFSIGFDGPPPDMQSTERQAIDKGMFGGIFRIDVDNRPENLPPNPHPDIRPGTYKIPADNPWVNATSFLGKPIDPNQVRGEFYAVGLRNPWQFSIDPVTGEVYCGDVGESTMEEVNLVQPGKNYGFPYIEGDLQHSFEISAEEFTRPLFSYLHGMTTNTGSAAIGGFVVHNHNYPNLDGAFLFGDFGSGNVWRLRRQPQINVEWIAREPGIAAFGQDPSNGDVLAINVGEGTIRRLVYVGLDRATVPQKLSQTGIFTDLAALTVAPGYEPFEINVPFWSDGAKKRRWFGLADSNARFGFIEDANWTFPKGSVWVKHFELETVKGNPGSARRLETRVLIKDANEVYGFTYRWGLGVTDAQLVPSCGMDEAIQVNDGGTIRTQLWRYPSRGECHSCHSRNAGFAAGFNTYQLNHEATHNGVTKNELNRLADLGYLDRTTVEPKNLQRLAPANDTTQPLEHRVKSFFAANCAICHHPDGLPIKARWDARLTTPLDSAKIIEGEISQPFYSWETDRVVRWRNVTNSALVQRMANFDSWTYHMPPFGSTVVNTEAIEMLTEWINALPEPQWIRKQIGTSPLFGSVAQPAGSLVIAGAGESPFFVHQRITNNFQIVGRIKNVPGRTAGIEAGPMIRVGDQSFDRTAALLQGGDGQNTFVAAGQTASSPGTSGFLWQRLIRENSRVTALESVDGQNWYAIGSSEGWTEPELLAGFSVASGDPWSFATVEFDDHSILSVGLKYLDHNYSLPASIPLSADVSAINTTLQRVDYWAGEQLIASVPQAPWQAQWTNAVVGEYNLRAVAFGANGLSVTSAPAAVSLTAEPPAAIFVGSASITSGIWQSTYGRLGYVLPLTVTNLPSRAKLTTDASTVRYNRSQTLYGLSDLTGHLVSTSWKDAQEFSLRFAPAFEDAYRVTIFLADYAHEGIEEEITLLSDAGVVLDRRVARNIAIPRFLTWAARGKIEIRVRSTTSKPAYLSGFFLDALPLPNITLASPTQGQGVVLPSNITLSATLNGGAAPGRRVEFYSDQVWIGSITNAPYDFVWTNALAGSHTLTAKLVDYFGRVFTSPAIAILCKLPDAHVTFTGFNGLTKGNWLDAFGADGFQLPLGPQQFRPYARIEIEPSVGLWEWVPGSSDLRAMRLPSEDFSLATCWTSGWRVDANIDFLDGNEHPLALYFLDFERVGAKQTLQITDAESGTILHELTLDDIGEGLYATWNVRGRIRVRLSMLTDWPAIMSGIFVGGPVSARQQWWARNFGGDFFATPQWLDDPDRDGRPNEVEYAVGTDPLTPDPPLKLTATVDHQALEIEANAVHVAKEVVITLERSTDLVSWEPSTLTRADTDENIRFTRPLPETGARYYRLRYALP